MSKFHLSRLREAATRDDVDDERWVTVKRARIARQMISPWTDRSPQKRRRDAREPDAREPDARETDEREASARGRRRRDAWLAAWLEA